MNGIPKKKSHGENCIFNDSSHLTALYMKRDCWSLYAILKVCEHWSRQNSTFSEAFPLAYLLTMSLNCLSEKKKHRSMLSWSGRSLEKQRKLIVSNSNNHVVQVPFLENPATNSTERWRNKKKERLKYRG